MIFLIDAHLPRRLARILQQYGHQAYHTLDLPHLNRTDDDEIMQFADTHDCIVTTKDSDLDVLIRANIDQVVVLFQQYRFVELNRTDLVVHM